MTTVEQLKKLIQVGNDEYVNEILGEEIVVYYGTKKKKKDYSILKHPLLVGVVCSILGALLGALLMRC